MIAGNMVAYGIKGDEKSTGRWGGSIGEGVYLWSHFHVVSKVATKDCLISKTMQKSILLHVVSFGLITAVSTFSV